MKPWGLALLLTACGGSVTGQTTSTLYAPDAGDLTATVVTAEPDAALADAGIPECDRPGADTDPACPHLKQTPAEQFVEAACTHIGCNGWAADVATCEYSWRAVMQNLGAQDAVCLSAATAVMKQSGCVDAVNAEAEKVVAGLCQAR